MEPIRVRYSVFHKDGATIAYLYGKEGFDMLNVPVEEYDGSQVLKPGVKLTYDATDYKVHEVRHIMLKTAEKIDTRYGVNTLSPQEAHGYEYDSAVIIVLENV
ncbi:hypothetical protein [Lewinella sp. JB7]|uniref:hypothetical protein n=1 Tax=Lewinella sp. JB7 TaxID=2962887 RepID=UPI0020C9A310|nr:hypothetical protein [Lewinella sp. JB7]MCP9237973.1 hypothetical protein [Lewinella sp. JB7]